MSSWLSRTLALTALLAIALTGGAQASTYTAILNAQNEVPPNNSPATGLATLILNDQTLQMSWQLDFAGLTSPTTASHIHRGPAGVNGPVIYPLALGVFQSGVNGVLQFNAADLPDLQNLGLYVNIHTNNFPGGEIRGQVRAAATPVEPKTWGAIKTLFR
jgi:hypothetical protein